MESDSDRVLAALKERGTLAEVQRRAGLPIERTREAILKLEHEKKIVRRPALAAWEQTWIAK